MSIYIDSLFTYDGKTYWCHMVGDTESELHSFAEEIGMKRSWYQRHPLHPHYDIKGNRMRNKAIKHGAVVLSNPDFIKKVKEINAK